MLYTCVQKFDVTRNLENFWELNAPSSVHGSWDDSAKEKSEKPDVGRTFRTLIKKLISELTWKPRDKSFEAFNRIISTSGLL